jgi:hypothetical protein
MNILAIEDICAYGSFTLLAISKRQTPKVYSRITCQYQHFVRKIARSGIRSKVCILRRRDCTFPVLVMTILNKHINKSGLSKKHSLNKFNNHLT